MQKPILKKIVIVFLSVLSLSLFFQNCAKKLVSDSASLLEEIELQKTYAFAVLEVVDVNQDKTAFSSTSTILSAFPKSKDTVNFEFQWKLNGNELPGQTQKDLVLSDLKPEHSGRYSVVIKTSLSDDQKLQSSEVETIVSNLVVKEKPAHATSVTILSQTQSMKVVSGTNQFLQVKHLEYPSASVQWFKDSIAIPGANEDQFILSDISDKDAGIYHAEVSNVTGKKTTKEILVLVDRSPEAPILRNVSSDQELAEEQPLNLFIEVLSVEEVSYQWYKDDQILLNESSPKLQIRNTLNSDEGVYKVRAIANSGSIEHTFHVRIIEGISVQTPLVGHGAAGVGQSVTFSTSLVGDIENIEWYKDNVLIPNQTQTSLTLTSVQIANEGRYKVVAINRFGRVAQEADLFVVRPPKMISEIIGKNLLYDTASDINSSILLSASFQGDGLEYQWAFRSTSSSAFIDLAGATSSSFSKTPLQIGDSGDYKLTVSNKSGSVNVSAKVQVISLVKISKGLESAKVPIGVTPFNLSIETTGNPSSYEWFKGSESIPGSSGSSYSFVASVAGDYKFDVTVYDALGGKATSTATITVIAKPVITTGPQDRTYFEGSSIGLSCYASGAEVKYQWYKDDVLIANATSSNFTKSGAKVADSGTYKCVVSNIAGSVSDSAVITVNPPAPPTITSGLRDTSSYEGVPVYMSVSATGSAPYTYKWYKNDILIENQTSWSLNISSVKFADAGTYKVVVSNAQGSATSSGKLVVIDHAMPVISSKSIPPPFYFEGDQLYLSVSASGGGLKYRWLKGGAVIAGYDGVTNSSFSLSQLKLSDAGIYKVEVFNSKGSVSATFDVKVTEQILPQFTVSLEDKDLFVNDYISLSIVATGGGMTYKWYKDNVLIPDRTSASYSKQFTGSADAGVYKIEATNSKGSVSSSAKITLKSNILPTVSLSLGSGATIWDGDFVTLSSTGNGGELKYQWFKDGIMVAGNTTYSFAFRTDGNVLRSVNVNDSGTYKVTVSNSVGSASAEVRLMVAERIIPKILSVPTVKAFKVGDPFDIRVSAEGGSLKYKWFKNDVLLPTAVYNYVNGSFDEIPGSVVFTAEAAGTYRVEVSNDKGSSSASIVVTVAP